MLAFEQKLERTYAHYGSFVHRAVLLFYFSATVVVFCLTFIPLYIWLGLDVAVGVCLYGLCSAVLLIVGLSFKLPLRVLGHFFCFSTVAFFSLTIGFNRGVFSPFVPWLVVAPISSGLILSKRETAFWSLFSGIVLLGVVVCSLCGHFDVDYFGLGQDHLISTFAYVGFFLYVIIMFGVYDRSRRISKKVSNKHKADLGTQRLRMKAVIEGQEQERQRLSRELHDSLGQQLTALQMKLMAWENNREAIDPGQVKRELGTVLHSMVNISKDLSPQVLSDFGLHIALKQLCNALKDSGVSAEIQWHDASTAPEISAEIEIHLYRIVQEVIQNVQKHAHADSVMVQLFWTSDQVRLTIEDDGVGFDLNAVEPGQGLKNIEDRVKMLNADFFIETRSNKGTLVSIDIPL